MRATAGFRKDGDGKEPHLRIIVRALQGAPTPLMATLRFLLKRFVAQRCWAWPSS